MLADLQGPINRFFTDVLVMADDPAVRRARLALVQRVAAIPAGIADLSQLQGFQFFRSIPRKLRVRGFMCYREEQALDFSGMHITSLTGDNGHGKSALLDAITWVLWGRARARRDDELITLGETDMWVDLEFGLGPQVYRVWRQRSKKGRGQSDLHFYVWNPAGNDWQLLDEGNLLQRQAQIIRTLRLDYETFVNSAFLLQGRADSFTVKTPTERKQILADILGLSRYDRYEERAEGAGPGPQGAHPRHRGRAAEHRRGAGASRRVCRQAGRGRGLGRAGHRRPAPRGGRAGTGAGAGPGAGRPAEPAQ